RLHGCFHLRSVTETTCKRTTKLRLRRIRESIHKAQSGAPYAPSEGYPAAREWRHSKEPVMAKQDDEKENGRHPESPAEDLRQTKPVTAGDHRSKGNIGRCVGKSVPRRNEFPRALGVNGH